MSWWDQAECRNVDPDLFFPERGASTAQAKAVCAGCPVRMDCLEHALTTGEKFGIWGGLSERERRRIRRQRGLVSGPGSSPKASPDRARRMADVGQPPHVIAAELGVTRRTVHRYLGERAS